MSRSVLIKGGTVLTMDARNPIVQGDLLIKQDRIAEIGAGGISADVVLDAEGCVVLPGFVQTHIHLCQTLFRGSADDLSLIDWLKKRIWPMEAAHTPASLRASAELGIAELIKGGTTCALTMETVRHTETVFEIVEKTGFRATVGKCMMDKGDGVPAELYEKTDDSLRESLSLMNKWHGSAGDRIRYCFAPRFAISCTRELLASVAQLAREHGVMIHTHASENLTECALVEQDTGLRNINYLDSIGLTGAHVALAHCVHVDDTEIEILKRSATNVVHCPSSNMKLGSGIAPIARMLASGVSVSLGSDGAACNNRLDMFTEMRSAALLQKSLRGPEVLPATRALQLATIDGARALGWEKEIGSLEPGKKADVIVVRLDTLHSTPSTDLTSALVYSAQPGDVRHVLIDGQLFLQDSKLITIDESQVRQNAIREAHSLAQRAGL